MISTHYQSTQVSPDDTWGCAALFSTACVIVALALIIIGVLGAFHVGALNALSNTWYYFEIAAVAIIAIALFSYKYCMETKQELEIQNPLSDVLPQTEKGNEKLKAESHHSSQQLFSDNDPLLLFARARLKTVNGSYEEAVDFLKKSQEGGNLDASYYLGRSYEIGEGVAQNLSSSKAYYTHAAIKGHLPSIYACMLQALKAKDQALVFWTKRAIKVLEAKPLSVRTQQLLEVFRRFLIDAGAISQLENMVREEILQEESRRMTADLEVFSRQDS